MDRNKKEDSMRNVKNLINKKVFLIFIFALVFSLSSVLGASLSSSELYKYKVYGNEGISSWSRPGYTIFIPTGSAAEWSAFKSAARSLWNMNFCTATDGVWGDWSCSCDAYCLNLACGSYTATGTYTCTRVHTTNAYCGGSEPSGESSYSEPCTKDCSYGSCTGSVSCDNNPYTPDQWKWVTCIGNICDASSTGICN